MNNDFHVALLRANLTVSELAAMLGVSVSSISRIVCGWVIPSEEIQKAIRRALGRHGRNLKFGTRLLSRTCRPTRARRVAS
ncbi:MAG: helix-turn-helix transcriptional regulator [Deltaproteobacteria bacterium]|nr:helix-turn-helix transcriptional regulator [Deltaproteobacteria bacterium]